jgi:HSP20 family protein
VREPALLLYWVSGVEGPAGALDGGVLRPATDIVECGDQILITIELAGAERDALGVSVVGDRLEVRAARYPQEPAGEGARHYLRREIVYAPFERVIVLPPDADPHSLEAEYRDGMLRIRLRRRPPETPHRVPIT